MKRKTLFISPAVEHYEIIKGAAVEFKYFVISNRDLIKPESTLAIIEPLNDITVIEAPQLYEKYKLPLIYITSGKDEPIPDIRSEKITPIINFTKDYDLLKQRIKKVLDFLNFYNSMDNQKMWFKGVLNCLTEAVIGIDENALIRFMNPIAQRIVGIEEQNAIGHPAGTLIKFKDPEELNIFNMEWQCYKDNNAFEGELYNRITKEYNPVSGSITSLRDRFGNFSGKVFTIKSIGEMKKLFKRVKYHASHDTLTGLLNRQSFIDKIDEYITFSDLDNTIHGLILISIDKFKIVNDTCGHIAGDELLRKVSYLLREIDPDNSIIKARVGGDEFGLLLKNSTLSEIKHFTKAVQRKITKHDFIWGDKEFPVRCSIGLTTIDAESTNHHSLLAALDDACAIAKEKGGNRIEIYDRVDDEYNKRRGEMLWIHKLKDAISNRDFQIYYQEIKALRQNSLKKIEILLRLKDEKGEVISPIDFIPPAERYGLMPEIDKIVIEKSIEACKKLLEDRSLKERYIFSVNISGTSIPDKSLPAYIQSIFQKYKVPPTLFCFEITETATITNLNLARSFIKNLKRIGCTFSLDDFGSGFSNFSYLKSLDVDFLKIDGSFIKNIIDEPINRAIVESINNIGHAMKLKTIGEFVHDNSVLEILKDIGVDYVQGYAVGRPTPIDNLLNSDRL